MRKSFMFILFAARFHRTFHSNLLHQHPVHKIDLVSG